MTNGFPDGLDSKKSACNAGDVGSVPGLGRSPGEGNGIPLQSSCLKSPMDRGACRVTVHGVAKSQIGLSNQTTMNKDIVKLFVCLLVLCISFQNYSYLFLSAVLGLCCCIQPVHPKGDQSWVLNGRPDAKAETLILWPPHWKRP